MSWFDAELECEHHGGYLAEPKTFEQMEFLTSLALVEQTYTNVSSWWIGLSDVGDEGVWAWIHAVEMAGDTFWEEVSPDMTEDNSRDCMFMVLSIDPIEWRDTDCLDESLISPLCQIDTNIMPTRFT